MTTPAGPHARESGPAGTATVTYWRPPTPPATFEASDNLGSRPTVDEAKTIGEKFARGIRSDPDLHWKQTRHGNWLLMDGQVHTGIVVRWREATGS